MERGHRLTKELGDDLEVLTAGSGARAISMACHDYENDLDWSHDGDRWYHAASTIKLAVLLAVYDVIQSGALPENARIHVRNQFISVADGRYYRVGSDRDANGVVHGYIGRTMKVRDLARHMIVTSSNLATNVLVDLLGIEGVRGLLDDRGIHGIDFRRGVEDTAAWERDINNRATANGLVSLLRHLVESEAIAERWRNEMMDILHEQEFNSGIPAGLPDEARVANKTGEISTVAHDAGVIYLPDREPYVLAVLSEWPEEQGDRSPVIAQVSRRVMEGLP